MREPLSNIVITTGAVLGAAAMVVITVMVVEVMMMKLDSIIGTKCCRTAFTENVPFRSDG